MNFLKNRIFFFHGLFIFVFLLLISSDILGDSKYDESFARQLLKNSYDRYNLKADGRSPFSMTIEYLYIGPDKKEISALINYFWQSNNISRQEIEGGGCKEVQINIGNKRYFPEPKSTHPDFCPGVIGIEPLEFYEHFSVTEGDKVNCRLDKLDNGNEVLRIEVKYGKSSSKKKSSSDKNSIHNSMGVPKLIPASRLFTFNKDTGVVLNEKTNFGFGFIETFSFQTIDQSAFPYLIKRLESDESVLIWKVTSYLSNASMAEDLFKVSQDTNADESRIGAPSPLKIIKDVCPQIPQAALALGVGGSVIVEVLIAEDGSVEKARIIDSTATFLKKPALDAAMQWKFNPPLDSQGHKMKIYFIRKITLRT